MLQLCEVMSGRAEQLGLFARRDAGCRTTKAFAGSQAYLDEHHGFPVLHDQVDFAEAAAIIACQQSQVMAEQEIEGSLLGIRAIHGVVEGC